MRAIGRTLVEAAVPRLDVGDGGPLDLQREIAVERGAGGNVGHRDVIAGEKRPVGEVPVRATVSLEEVTWGTRVGLTCTYDPESVSYELPSEADYLLFVRTRSGGTEQVGSWRSVGGKEMTIMAATARTPAELASVEVRTTDGRVVLRLKT